MTTDPLVALDIEHRTTLAEFWACDSTDSVLVEALGSRQGELAEAIATTPATTWDGVIVKLRYLEGYHVRDEDWGIESHLSRNVIDDVKRLAAA